MNKKKIKKKENKKQQQEFVVAREGRLEKPDLCRIVWNSNNGLLAGNLVEMDWTDRLAHPGDVLTQNRGVSASALPGQAVWVMDVLDCLLRKGPFFFNNSKCSPERALG